MDDLDLVPVGSFLVRHEAEIAAARLRSEGIESMVLAEDEGGLNPGFFDEYRVRLLVRQEDAERAAAAIDSAADQQLRVHPEQLAAMDAHAAFCDPLEACGLLAFDSDGRLNFVYPLTNTDASPHRFTVDPVEQFRAIQHAERNSWEVLGTFHSHPASEPVPSATDMEAAGVGDWIHVIVGSRETKAYVYTESGPEELEVVADAGPVR